jgi:integrase
MRMGRHKKHNRHLPRGMSLEWGTYYFRGTDRRRTNLGRDFADAMRKYGELFRDVPLSTFAAVLDRYLQQITPKKAARTQVDERRYIGKLRAVFGDMPSRAILPTMVADMRDKIAAKSGGVQANHHLKTIKHVFTKAVEWGVLPVNPAREVSRVHVEDRDRYVTDEELAKVYAAALPMVQVAIDLAVLTGLRRGDLLALTKTQLRDDGIHVRTSKTKRGLIIAYSAELTEVLERAKLMKPHFRQHIIATRAGKQFTGDGFSTLWRRAMHKAFPEGQEAQRFTFNDLRSKSASDTMELAEASARLGHTTTTVTKRHYVRKPAVVKPLR